MVLVSSLRFREQTWESWSQNCKCLVSTFHVGVWTLEEKAEQKRGGRDETHMVPGSDKEHLVRTEASVQMVVVK